MTTNKKPEFKTIALETRKAEAERILKKYPDRIPVIVTKSGKSQIADIDKNKFLVPGDLTFGQFQYVIRKRIKLAPEQAIFTFADCKGKQHMIQPSLLMKQVYHEQKEEDLFLHVIYSAESTFG